MKQTAITKFLLKFSGLRLKCTTLVLQFSQSLTERQLKPQIKTLLRSFVIVEEILYILE